MSPTLPSGNINNINNTANPLNVLESNGYNVTNFIYPIDLSTDPGENHMIIFYINENDQTQFLTGNRNITGGLSQNINGTNVSPTPSNRGTIISGTQLGYGQPAQATYNQSGNVTTNTPSAIGTNRVSTVIALYIPPLVQTTYQTQWDATDFGATGGVVKALVKGDIVRALSEGALGTMAGMLESAKDFTTNKLGIDLDPLLAAEFETRAARNPNTEMLFRSIGFREYQFDFKFTPRSEPEAISVSNIIKAFKFYSAPETRVAKNTARYYLWPATFDIEFWSNGKPNTFINKISTCACTEVSINYTGSGGWSAFRPGNINGMSVETNLSLRFKEIEIITKNRILEGF